MCGPGCKTFLLNPVYSPLEIHYRQVVPYLVMLEIQSPISALRFLILYYVYGVGDASVPLDSIYLIRHYYNITGFSYQSVWGYRKVKTICVYVWIGLTIIISFERIFKVKQMVGVYSHQSHD